MGNCIFCKKQTNNEYSYYVAYKGTREEVTVFSCTKCLKKKGVIIFSIITLIFVVSLFGNIGQMLSGEKDVEVGPIVVASVLIIAFLLLTLYNLYCIKTDKPLSEESAAKKLIKKAKKANPAKIYFTPAENVLSATKNIVFDTVKSTSNPDYSTIENTVDNDLYGLMPEDFGKSLDEALFFEWKESVRKLNKSLWIQTVLFILGLLPGILYALIVRTKIDKKILNLQIRLGITYSDVKQARINCKSRIKMRSQ